MFRNIFLRFWFPVIAYSVIIFCLSALEKVPTPLHGINFDKVIHLFEYVPFGVLLARAFIKTEIFISFKTVFWVVLICSFMYGLSDEFHQYFVPGRNSSFFDVLADMFGGALGGWIYPKFLLTRKTK